MKFISIIFILFDWLALIIGSRQLLHIHPSNQLSIKNTHVHLILNNSIENKSANILSAKQEKDNRIDDAKPENNNTSLLTPKLPLKSENKIELNYTKCKNFNKTCNILKQYNLNLIQKSSTNLKSSENLKTNINSSLLYARLTNILDETRDDNSYEKNQYAMDYVNELLKSERHCTNYYNCLTHLNERCIPKASYNVCDCAYPFYRDSKTKVCQIIKGALIKVKFYHLNYTDELENVYSPKFIDLKDQVEKSLRFIMNSSDILASGIININALGFEMGSLLVKALIFVRNELFVDNFKVSLAREMTTAVLNQKSGDEFYNTSIVSIDFNVDPCTNNDLNYCSKNSECISSSSSLHGFYCKCLEGFTDLSPNNYFGEVCKMECPLSYCENGGHCLINHKDLSVYCACQDWNVGNRCQFTGYLVFSVFGIIVILLMLIVACTAVTFCSRRTENERIISASLDERPFRIDVNHYDTPIKSRKSFEETSETQIEDQKIETKEYEDGQSSIIPNGKRKKSQQTQVTWF